MLFFGANIRKPTNIVLVKPPFINREVIFSVIAMPKQRESSFTKLQPLFSPWKLELRYFGNLVY